MPQPKSRSELRRRQAQAPSDPLLPSASLLCKLGSIIVHLEEGSDMGGHVFDWIALNGLLNDPEVRDWLASMRDRAFLPVRR